MTSDFNFQKAREAWGDKAVAPTHRVFQEWLNNPLTKALKQSHKDQIEKLEARFFELVWAYGELKREVEESGKKQVVYQLSEQDIFDFAGWLTSRNAVMRVGSTCEAGPMAEAVGEYIKKFPERFQQFERKWVELTPDEVKQIITGVLGMPEDHTLLSKAIKIVAAAETKLKDKNL
jgi:hypothetical protein